jgi:hypothetical protein
MTLRTLALILGLSASPALAEGFYFGGGLSYSNGTSESEFIGTNSDLKAGMATLILGQRFEAGTGFFGWETSADLSFGADTDYFGGTCAEEGADGPYLCTHDATVRVVGIYGTSIGSGTEVFGSLGVGTMLGDYATSPSTVESARTYGVTFGLGVNHDLANGLTLRGEVIRDRFTRDTQEDYDSTYSGTTVRVALLRKF